MKGVGVIQTQFLDIASAENPFALENGDQLKKATIAYETYGKLNAARSNAILVFHALTGSAHAAGINHYGNFPKDTALGSPIWTDECEVGWWDSFIGAGRAFDTDKYFIICANILGSCYGSTGPASIDPDTGKPYGSRFPDVTVADIVRSQIKLLDHLGIECLLATVGGSLGGMLAMDFAMQAPARVRLVIPLASGVYTPALTRVLNFEQLFAIQEDRNYNRGDYYDGPHPYHGLVLARMIGHKTFVSLDVMQERAKGYIIQDDNDLKGYRMRHQIESYMLHQGKKFAKRFDANSYVRILTAWQSYDLAQTYGNGNLVNAFHASLNHRYLIISIDSDVCFWPEEQALIARYLQMAGVDYRYVTVHSDKGHDSFLIEPELYTPLLSYTLAEELMKTESAK